MDRILARLGSAKPIDQSIDFRRRHIKDVDKTSNGTRIYAKVQRTISNWVGGFTSADVMLSSGLRTRAHGTHKKGCGD